MARGHIRKRYFKKPINGYNYSYSVVYYLGKKPKWETVGPNLKDAQRLLAQRLSEINNGTYLKPPVITFREFSQQWLETKYLRVKPSTYRGYQSDLNRHLLPVFGDDVLININRAKVDQVLNKIRKHRAADTVNNIRLTLLMIFNYAKSLQRLTEPFPLEHKEMDFLTPNEIRKLLKYPDEPFRTLFFTAVMTGKRRGELLGLQWGDMDWSSNTIFVRRSLYWLMKKENASNTQRWRFIEPKSKRSKRAIVVSPKLKEVLEIYRLTAINNQYDLVFCNKEGYSLDPDNMVKRQFQPALSMAGLRKIRFHDLRHTYATLLINQGENIKFIQQQMGHASIQTTMDTYGHLLPVNQYGVGSKLDGQIFPSNSIASQVVPV